MSELIVNGTFDTDATGWSASSLASLSVVDSGGADGNRLRVTNTGTGVSYAFQAFATVVGVGYRVKADLFQGTAGAPTLFIGNSQGSGGITVVTGAGSRTTTFVATAITTFVSLRNNSLTTAGKYNEFDNVGVKPLPPRVPARSSHFLT
jgi:hypothetical protein